MEPQKGAFVRLVELCIVPCAFFLNISNNKSDYTSDFDRETPKDEELFS